MRKQNHISPLRILLVLVFLYLCMPKIILAQAREYTLKAAFLEKLTRFIEWPQHLEMSDTTKPFILGVVGKNPFGSILEQIYTNFKIKNKDVTIRYINEMNDISGCHLLFITKSEKRAINRIIRYTQRKPILTIGDTDGYAEAGVIINLYIKDETIQFAINETALQETGLFADYLLLRISKIVNPISNRE